MIDAYFTLPSPLCFYTAFLFFLFGTVKAFQHRHAYGKLVAWGLLADVALAAMALSLAPLGISTPQWQAVSGAQHLAVVGATLFVLFQVAARGLAFSAYKALCKTSKEVLYAGKDSDALQKAALHNPKAALLFAMGLLAAVGGSAFLMPEGRFFLTQGIIASTFFAVLPILLIVAACSIVFVWLHLAAVRKIYLETTSDTCTATSCTEKQTPSPCFLQGKVGFCCLLFGAAILAMGFLRTPITTLVHQWLNINLEHAPYSLSSLPFMVLFYGAFIHAFICTKFPRFLATTSTAIMVMAFISVLCMLPLEMLSPMAQLFALLITGMGVVVSLYSAGYMAHAHRKHAYYFFLLLTFAALLGIVTSSNLGTFYGYWELMTFASFFLVVHERTGKGAKAVLDAGNKYYIMCAGGALFMLPSLALLGGTQASLVVIAQITSLMPSFTLKISLVLALLGFAVKAGVVPLHAWLPDAHPAAPSSVSGPLSGIITKMGIFGIITLLLGEAGTTALAQQGPMQGNLSWIGYNLSFLGGITLIYGEIMALRQDDIKRILAYSTLGQVGEIILVLGLGTYLSTVAALTHVVNHAIMKDLLFLGAGVLILRTGSRKLEDLRGLGQEMPFTVACMSIGLLGIMGLPPFAGFMGKYLMIQAAINTGHWLMAALIVAGSLVGAVYYVRILRTLVFEKAPHHAHKHMSCPTSTSANPLGAKISMSMALGLLAGLTVLLGLCPQLTQGIITTAASQYFDSTLEATLVLNSMEVTWPIYVLVPMLGAILPILLRKDRIRAGQSAIAVLLLSALLVCFFGQDLDRLSFGFALLVPLIGALNIAYALGYMEHSHSQWRFYTFFCAMCAGLMGLSAAKNLFSFFLFWEIMSSWALYFTIAHEGTKDSLREGFKYFLFNLSGAGCIFLGVCMLGGHFSLDYQKLESIRAWSAAYPEAGAQLWGFAAYALLALGFVMKAAQLPLRIDWQMHPALAPTPVSGFISSVLLKSALLGLMKLFIIIGGALTLLHSISATELYTVQTLIMWIGGITIVMASVQALCSSNLKLVFIYSTVSQIGYMVLALAVGTSLGFAGSLLHVINHVFFKDLLFLMCGVLMFQSHKDNLQDLGGIGHKMPFTLTMFAIAGLSVVGVPPTSGFTSKWIIYHALMQANQPFLALLSLIGSVITLAYIAKFLHTAFMGQPGQHLAHVQDATPYMRVPMTILAVGCVALGLFPGLALFPINAVLTEYGMQGLNVGFTGIHDGPAAWNATNMFVMMLLAFVGTWKGLTYFVNKNYRITPVHSCGLTPEEATSRMQPTSVYGGLMTFWHESLVPTLLQSFKKEK